MPSDGEYRCPNCLRSGKTGLNLGYFLPGVPIYFGAPLIEIKPPYWVICFTCYSENVLGVRGERGLVMEVTEWGEVLMLPVSVEASEQN